MITADTPNKMPKGEQAPGKVGGRQILEDMIVVYSDWNLFHNQCGAHEINFNAWFNHLKNIKNKNKIIHKVLLKDNIKQSPKNKTS